MKLAVLLIFILHKSDAADAVRESLCVCVLGRTWDEKRERVRNSERIQENDCAKNFCSDYHTIPVPNLLISHLFSVSDTD